MDGVTFMIFITMSSSRCLGINLNAISFITYIIVTTILMFLTTKSYAFFVNTLFRNLTWIQFVTIPCLFLNKIGCSCCGCCCSCNSLNTFAILTIKTNNTINFKLTIFWSTFILYTLL